MIHHRLPEPVHEGWNQRQVQSHQPILPWAGSETRRDDSLHVLSPHHQQRMDQSIQDLPYPTRSHLRPTPGKNPFPRLHSLSLPPQPKHRGYRCRLSVQAYPSQTREMYEGRKMFLMQEIRTQRLKLPFFLWNFIPLTYCSSPPSNQDHSDPSRTL